MRFWQPMRFRQQVTGCGGRTGQAASGNRGFASPSRGGRARRRSCLGLLCIALCTTWGLSPLPPTPSAAADDDRVEPHRSPDAKVVACRGCPEPDDAWYRWEMGPFFRDGGAHPDVYETDGGECKAKPLGVKVAIEGYVWEPAGEGVVQDCPSGRFSCTLDLRLGPDARFEWEVDADKSRGIETARALCVEARADAATTGACGRGVTLSLTQRIEAAHCHRMRWAAAFLLARLRAKADFAVERRWRWWIKNANWGDEVLYSGDTWRPCDAAHVEMTRLAPVSVHLATRDGACPDAECATVTVTEGDGWAPAPPETAPEYTPLRVTTVTEKPEPPTPVDPPKEPAPPAASPTTTTPPTGAPTPTPVDPRPTPSDDEPPHSPYPPIGPIPGEFSEDGDAPPPEFGEPWSPWETPSDRAEAGR